jgi:murein DD-endopeptidase MepM/ murein hydrolase activator NlpD
VEIFGWNIDFSLDLQPKDTFRVLYEDNRLEGERVKTGPILAAEIVNDGKRHVAIRYTDKNGHTAYFSPEGYGMHQAFLRTPVTFTRISSNFGMRNHPILHKLRRHTGVDYSAPIGTPVKSTSDGKVVFVGKKGGYGNVVELQHGARYSTLYGHLSKFAKGLKAGATVSQGQVIGFVGKTGLATGPHLHYEFRIDGIHRDPLTVALPRRNPLSNENKKQFLAHAQKMLRLMEQHENQVGVASAAGFVPAALFDE